MMMMMMTQIADSDDQLSQVEFLCHQVDRSATWHVSDLTMSRGSRIIGNGVSCKLQHVCAGIGDDTVEPDEWNINEQVLQEMRDSYRQARHKPTYSDST